MIGETHIELCKTVIQNYEKLIELRKHFLKSYSANNFLCGEN